MIGFQCNIDCKVVKGVLQGFKYVGGFYCFQNKLRVQFKLVFNVCELQFLVYIFSILVDYGERYLEERIEF